MTGDPLLALVGPTASGKTEASIHLAQAMDAEILCVDSTTVYRGMDAGTAKPTAAHTALVPHHLVDAVDPGQPLTVAAFQRLAGEAIREIRGRNRRPLLVGGSGLYYRAVVDGLRFPPTEPATRALLEAEGVAAGGPFLHRRLASFDPAAAARIDPSNTRRTVRALEVAAVTGRPFSSFSRAWARYPGAAVRAAGIQMDRSTLDRRIEERSRRVFPEVLAETERLVAAGCRPFLLGAQVIGYAEAVAVCDGSLAPEAAVTRMIRRTRTLARRQMGWFRRDPRIRWFAVGADGAVSVLSELLEYLGGPGFRAGSGVGSERAARG